MKYRKLTTDQLREVLTYVARFDNTTFAIAVDSRALEGADIRSVAEDISLLHGVGIRIILVVGASDHAEYSEKRATRTARLTTFARQLSRSINTSVVPSGQPANGGSEQYILNVNGEGVSVSSLRNFISDILSKDMVPIIMATPKSGRRRESWFGALLTTITGLCNTVLIDKLIYLSGVDGIFLSGKTLLREAQPSEVKQLVVSGVITGQFREFAAMAEHIISSGVQRVHCINGKVIGNILTEVFSKDGVGTMIHNNCYQRIRPAQASDMSGILNILGVLESHGDVRRHTEETVEAHLAEYRVAVKDDRVIACGCLHCFPEEGKAHISSFAVDQPYLTQGIGELMLESLFQEAGKSGVTFVTLIIPEVGQWWLSQKFTTGTIDDLPAALQHSAESPRTAILTRRLTT